MKTDELKLRLMTTIEEMIDTYFNGDTFVEKIANSTCKAFINANTDKVDEFLKMFADKEGNIDAATIISYYLDQMGEDGFSIDVKEYVKNISDVVNNIRTAAANNAPVTENDIKMDFIVTENTTLKEINKVSYNR